MCTTSATPGRRILNNKSSISNQNQNQSQSESQDQGQTNSAYYSYTPRDWKRSNEYNNNSTSRTNTLHNMSNNIHQPRIINNANNILKNSYNNYNNQYQFSYNTVPVNEYYNNINPKHNNLFSNTNKKYNNHNSNNSSNNNGSNNNRKIRNAYRNQQRQNNNQNGNNKKVQYKEITSTEDIDDHLETSMDLIKNRYFSKASNSLINFADLRDPEGRLRPIIGTTSKQIPTQTYKLSTPIVSGRSNFNVLSGLINNKLRSNYHKLQSLKFAGNNSLKVESIKDFHFDSVSKISEKKSVKIISPPASPIGTPIVASSSSTNLLKTHRHLTNTTTYNDSFDLSFDGKAMDRSDIFRMVDSFSIAFSDNDDTGLLLNEDDDDNEDGNDENNFINSNHNNNNNNNNNGYLKGRSGNILPAEITSVGF